MGTQAIAYTLFAVSRVVSLRSDMSDASCEVISGTHGGRELCVVHASTLR